jgi:hypothetical protein
LKYWLGALFGCNILFVIPSEARNLLFGAAGKGKGLMERHFEKDLNKMKERLLWSAAACCRFSAGRTTQLGLVESFRLDSIAAARN